LANLKVTKKKSFITFVVRNDLGEYFWPRYIKQGKCSGDAKNDAKNDVKRKKTTQSEEYDDDDDYVDEKKAENSAGGCSWPEGMKCVQVSIL